MIIEFLIYPNNWCIGINFYKGEYIFVVSVLCFALVFHKKLSGKEN